MQQSQTRFPPSDRSFRLSESPARTPDIRQSLISPARSLHPTTEAMESVRDQSDLGHRTTDFFDDTSGDEILDTPQTQNETLKAELAPLKVIKKPRDEARQAPEPPAHPQVHRKSRMPVEGHEQSDPSQTEDAIKRPTIMRSTDFNEPMDGFEQDGDNSGPPKFPKPARLSGGQSVRTSRLSDRFDRRLSRISSSSNVDQILGAHAIAHEIALQALMRDEDALDRTLQSCAPLHPGDRSSVLPPSLVLNDPRNIDRFISAPSNSYKKSVQVISPHIDTDAPPRSLPPDMVRTPYPYMASDRVSRKCFGPTPRLSEHDLSTTECILTLSIRRSNAHGKLRHTDLVLPAISDHSASLEDGETKQTRKSKSVDFDDAEFFRELRRSYVKLSGPFRLLSARTLNGIDVSGPATRAADLGYGWLRSPKSPRDMISKGMSSPFGGETMLRYFRNPALGKSRYAFVQWARRLAAAPSFRLPRAREIEDDDGNSDMIRHWDGQEGLEFVMSWSFRRILLALLLVLSLSIAATLLWIFLGKTTVMIVRAHGGFRDAGDRVASGVLLGICVLIMGFGGILGWLGLSWLII